MLTREQLERFKGDLLKERAAIESRLRDQADRIRATVAEPDDTVDEGDQATMVRDRDQAMIEREIDTETLEKVDRALARVEEGTYGVSEVSGRPIPIERLEAIPWATTLVDEPDPEAT